MTLRHQQLLTTRLEDAYLHGCSRITGNELRYWYDVDRIGKATWRDLAERWDNLTEGKNGNLMKIVMREGNRVDHFYIFGADTAIPVNPDGQDEEEE